MKKFGFLISFHLIISLCFYFAFQSINGALTLFGPATNSLINQQVFAESRMDSSHAKSAIPSALQNSKSNSPNTPKLTIMAGIVSTTNSGAIISPTLPTEPIFESPSTNPAWRGTITSARLAASPINSDASNLDGDDIVTVAVIIENQGGGTDGVFDIFLRVEPIEELLVPTLATASNIQARTGAGDEVEVEERASGLFGSGISLSQKVGGGTVLTDFSENSGTNIVIVTFDIAIKQSIAPSVTLPIMAIVDGYSFITSENSVVIEFPSADNQESALLHTRAPTLESTILSTSQPHTSDLLPEMVPMAVGEIITYAVKLEVPEGVAASSFLKSELDRGYGLVGISSISASPNVTTTNPDGFEGVRNTLQLINTTTPDPNQGQAFQLNFGTLAVRNDGSDGPGIIEVHFQAVLLNTEFNRQNEGVLRRDQYLQFCWEGADHGVNSHTPQTYLQEPVLQISQLISPSKPTIGDVVTVTMSISHGLASQSDAFDLQLSNRLPNGLDYLPGSLAWTERGIAPDQVDAIDEGLLQADWQTFPPGSQSTLQFQAVVTDSRVNPNENAATISILDEATLAWSSLPGTQNQTLSTFHELAAERTGDQADVGGATNSYIAKATSLLEVEVDPLSPAQVRLDADLTALNLSRAEGHTQAGDRIQYQIKVQNRGLLTATGVLLQNRLDLNLELVNDSVRIRSDEESSTTLIQPNKLTSNHLTIDIGRVAHSQAITITYEATVRSTLSPDLTQIINQALLYGDNFTLVASDDPSTPQAIDATVLPASHRPRLFATNQVSLADDVDGNGWISAGDAVLHEIQVVNRGTMAANGVVFYDQMPIGAALRFDTVKFTKGTIVVGSSPGDTRLQVDIGQMLPDEVVTVRFQAVVNGLRSNSISQVHNQGVILADNHPVVLTDDPTTLPIDDPTVVTLTEAPSIAATQSAYLVEDKDGNGRPSAGDEVAYLVLIQNRGPISATDIIISSDVDPSTRLVADSLRISTNGDLPATVITTTAGMFETRTPLISESGALADADQMVLSYIVEINDPLPADVTTISSQSSISGKGFAATATRDPYHTFAKSRTTTVVSETATLRLWKQDILLIDANQDGAFSPPTDTTSGDRLVYRLAIENAGPRSATQVFVEDTIEETIKLVPETLRISRGETLLGATNDSVNVLVDLRSIAGTQVAGAAEKAVVSFEVEFASSEIPDQIVNMANLLVKVQLNGVDGVSEFALPSDDPDTVSLADSTVTLVIFVPTGLEESIEPNAKKALPTLFIPIMVNVQ